MEELWHGSKRKTTFAAGVCLLLAISSLSQVDHVGRLLGGRQPNETIVKSADGINTTAVVPTIFSYAPRDETAMAPQPLNNSAANQDTSSLLDLFEPRRSIRRLWNCGDLAGLNKLIFVHIFKTAGSTLRAFFNSYGEQCRKGVTLMVGCSKMKPPRNFSSTWDKPCQAEFIYRRNHKDRIIPSSRGGPEAGWSFDDLITYETDILMGHIPIGLGDQWIDKDEQKQLLAPAEAQYVTFVREPVHKFVSGRLFTEKQYRKELKSYEEAIERIRNHVFRERAYGRYYDGYSPYLLTPEQKVNKPRMQDKVALVQQNLVEFPVLIGVTERMSDSLDLLRYVINQDGAVDKVFDRLDPATETKTTVVANKSSLSTSKLVESLRQDKEFWKLLQEYLKFEFPVYDFALQLHVRQVEWLHQTKVRKHDISRR